MPTDATAGSYLDVIAAGRWRETLFGTYVLNAAFFESELLTSLQLSRCESITILVDQKGYRDSTVEALAAGPGLDYRLVPVRVNGGIFHPKFGYLVGEGEDILLVGSGNLTYGGHGRNIEVLELLRSTRDAPAFLDFAEFLRELLKQSERIGIHGQRGTIERIAARAQKMAAGNVASWPRLKSSLFGPLHMQIADLAREHVGKLDELYVLAPYHHPRGDAIRNLLRECPAKRVLIGVQPRDQVTGFPVTKFHEGSAKIQAVIPAGLRAKDERPLHAKWIELRGSRRSLVVTGSVNATLEALCEQRNVELAVARLRPTARAQEQPARNARTEPSEFPKGKQTEPFLIASLEASGAIRGTLFADACEGLWRYRIEAAGQPTKEGGQCNVTAEGVFTFVTGRKGALVEDAALQLILERDGKTAIGWVAIEPVLEAGASARRQLRAMLRKLRGKPGSVGDFLTYVWGALEGFAVEASEGRNGAGEHKSRGGRGGSGGSGTSSDILDALLRSLMTTSEASLPDEVNSPDDETESAEAGASRKPKKRRGPPRPRSLPPSQDAAALDALAFFNRRLGRERLGPQGSHPGTHESHAGAQTEDAFQVPIGKVLAVQMAMNFEVLLDRVSEPRRYESLQRALEWLRSLRAHAIVAGDPLRDNMVIGVAATLGRAMNDQRRTDHNRFATTRDELADLARYYFGSGGQERALERLHDWGQSGWAKTLCESQEPEAVLREDAKSLFAGDTLDEKLRSLALKCLDGHIPPLDDWPLGADAKAKIAQKLKPATDAKTILAIADGEETGCPKCSVWIAPSDRAELRSRRVMLCPSGSHLILWLSKPSN